MGKRSMAMAELLKGGSEVCGVMKKDYSIL